jgi:hypothetical protein
MRRLLVAVTVILLSAMRVPAAVVLDQQHNVATSIADSTNGAVSEVAQTFTVGVAGTLDHFEISMFQLNSIFTTSGDPQLSVYSTAGGVPTGTALATVQIPSAQVPLNTAAFVSFDVSASSIPVTVGEVLAFGVFTSSDPGPYFLPYDDDTGAADDYTAGAAYRRTRPADPWQSFQPTKDHEFRTFVNAVSPTYQAGDFNLDGHVNAADILPMELALTNLSSYKATYAPGILDSQLALIDDVNGDGKFTVADLQKLLINLKNGGGSADPVPEPSTFVLAVLAFGTMWWRFRFNVGQSQRRLVPVAMPSTR